MSGYGVNSETESKYAFERAGAEADIIHINDLITGMYKMSDYNIMMFPGGFSYGDDTGAGNAYEKTLKIRKVLAEKDPYNSLWQVDLAKSCKQMAILLMESAEEQESHKMLNQALKILEQLQKEGKLSPNEHHLIPAIRDLLTKLGDETPTGQP